MKPLGPGWSLFATNRPGRGPPSGDVLAEAGDALSIRHGNVIARQGVTRLFCQRPDAGRSALARRHPPAWTGPRPGLELTPTPKRACKRGPHTDRLTDNAGRRGRPGQGNEGALQLSPSTLASSADAA